MPAFQNIQFLNGDTITNSSGNERQDSIIFLDTSQSNQARQQQSRFFTSKNTEPATFNPDPLPQPQNEWQIVALSISFLAIAFVRVSTRNFFRHLYSGLISRPIFKQLLRDGELIPQTGKAPLLIAFLLVITVFILQFNIRYPFIGLNQTRSMLHTGLIVLSILGIYEISRYLIMQLLGFTFRVKWIVREFITNNIFFNTLSTLLVLPLLLVSIYARTNLILYAGTTILFILFIIRMIRAVLISSELSSFSGYQIFLYICALEILPVFVVIKFLTGYISEI